MSKYINMVFFLHLTTSTIHISLNVPKIMYFRYFYFQVRAKLKKKFEVWFHVKIFHKKFHVFPIKTIKSASDGYGMHVLFLTFWYFVFPGTSDFLYFHRICRILQSYPTNFYHRSGIYSQLSDEPFSCLHYPFYNTRNKNFITNLLLFHQMLIIITIGDNAYNKMNRWKN